VVLLKLEQNVLIREHLQEAVVPEEDHTTNVLQDRIISLVQVVLANQERTLLLLQEANREVAEAAQEVVAQNPEVPVHVQEVVLANIKYNNYEKSNIFNPTNSQSHICFGPNSR